MKSIGSSKNANFQQAFAQSELGIDQMKQASNLTAVQRPFLRESPKVEIKKSQGTGLGAFAKEAIYVGETVASFNGPVYELDHQPWTADLLSHTIQFGPKSWRDSLGPARYLNHSCDPNCGISGLFDLVAMRTVQPGEELTWDYEMTEDSEWWTMKCRCRSAKCRNNIGAYRRMPQEIRKTYKGFISEWLEPAPTPAPCFNFRRQVSNALSLIKVWRSLAGTRPSQFQSQFQSPTPGGGIFQADGCASLYFRLF